MMEKSADDLEIERLERIIAIGEEADRLRRHQVASGGPPSLDADPKGPPAPSLPAEQGKLEGAPGSGPSDASGPAVEAKGASPRQENGRFSKGASPNPRGRPRSKVRAHTNQQQSEDWIDVVDAEVIVTIKGKPKSIPGHKALIMQILSEAYRTKDIKMMQFVLEQYNAAIAHNNEAVAIFADWVRELENLIRTEVDEEKREKLRRQVAMVKGATRLRK